MIDWLPGFDRRPLGSTVRGRAYQYHHNPKGCLHTTEGGSIDGAIAAYSPYPPHLVYDWRTRQRVQHVPLTLASYSAKDGNDDDYMIQVELVGFARDTRGWSDEALQRIAEDVARPLEQHFDIPRRAIWHGFKDERDGVKPYLSSTTSPIRITSAQLRDFSGWLGHQHLPAPDTHWDPGAFPIARMFAFMMEDDMQLTDQINTLTFPPDKPQTVTVGQMLAEIHRQLTAGIGMEGRPVDPARRDNDLGHLVSLRAEVAKLRTEVAALKAAGTAPDVDALVAKLEAAINGLQVHITTGTES